MKLQLDINVYLHHVAPSDGPVLTAINNQGKQIMSALQNLIDRVNEVKTTNQSAVALIQGLKAKLDEAIASGDMSQVQSLVDELDASENALAAAVTANTPAEPTPAP